MSRSRSRARNGGTETTRDERGDDATGCARACASRARRYLTRNRVEKAQASEKRIFSAFSRPGREKPAQVSTATTWGTDQGRRVLEASERNGGRRRKQQRRRARARHTSTRRARSSRQHPPPRRSAHEKMALAPLSTDSHFRDAFRETDDVRARPRPALSRARRRRRRRSEKATTTRADAPLSPPPPRSSSRTSSEARPSEASEARL